MNASQGAVKAVHARRAIRKGASDWIFDIVCGLFLAFFFLITVYPLWYVVIASFSSTTSGLRLWPIEPTLMGYEFVITQGGDIWVGYKNTLIYVTGGTLLSLAVTLPGAYALSKRDFVGKKSITVFLTVTMFFGGGMIPSYMVIRGLGLLNTRFLIMLLGCVSAYNVIVTRTFFQSALSNEVLEAATIDGCSVGMAFFRIALPLSKPIIAVMAMYSIVGRWNSYFTELIYLRDRALYPLGLFMKELLLSINAMADMMLQAIKQGMDSADVSDYMEQKKLAAVAQYVVIIVATLPMMIMYPFFQKYFVKGVMVGSIKG